MPPPARKSRNTSTCLAVISTTCLAPLAAGNAFDQIGPDSGTHIGTDLWTSQRYESAYSMYDAAYVDDFSISQDSVLTSIDFVVGGWNGFSGPSAIRSVALEVYSNNDTVCTSFNLVGDLAHVESTEVDWSSSWQGQGSLGTMRLNPPVRLLSGTAYLAVVVENWFSENGQCGIHTSFIGDDQSWIVQPGFESGCQTPKSDNAAYRLDLSPDCNNNGVPDGEDIANGDSNDDNANGIPDECETGGQECLGDLDGDGRVGVTDLLLVLDAWGPCSGCNQDLSGDGSVGVPDLLAILDVWGACP